MIRHILFPLPVFSRDMRDRITNSHEASLGEHHVAPMLAFLSAGIAGAELQLWIVAAEYLADKICTISVHPRQVTEPLGESFRGFEYCVHRVIGEHLSSAMSPDFWMKRTMLRPLEHSFCECRCLIQSLRVWHPLYLPVGLTL